MLICPSWRAPKWGPIALNSFLVIGSALCVWRFWPEPGLLFPGLGAMSLVSLLLNTGWSPGLTVLGAYVGFIIDARVKSGPLDAQLLETAVTIFVSTAVGLAAGFFMDIHFFGRRAQK